MPFLLTEAALEAHQKELEQEAQPVLLYGASSPRHSPQHHDTPPPPRGGFAGFLGSLVSSIGKRGVLGGSKLSSQAPASCTSPLMKSPDVSQFSGFSQGSRLDKFLTDAAKSVAVVAHSPPALSRADGGAAKHASKPDRSSIAHQIEPIRRVVKEEEPHADAPRRNSVPHVHPNPISAPSLIDRRPLVDKSSSGSARSNSASSLSSEDAIRNGSQALKPISAQALLSASVQVPTLSEIRSRISMLDGSIRDHQQVQHTPSNVTKEKPLDRHDHLSSNSQNANVANHIPVTASSVSTTSEPHLPHENLKALPHYSLLQSAPLTAANRSKWKQPTDTTPAASLPTQGGWHYRSVKKLSDAPEVKALSSPASVPGTAASTPPWLKVDNSPTNMSHVSSLHHSLEPAAATRAPRHNVLALDSDPNLSVSSHKADNDSGNRIETNLTVESSAAAQRRARQSAFIQTQKLSTTKTYAKDFSESARSDGANLKKEFSPGPVPDGSSSVANGPGQIHMSPGQVFKSIKVASSQLETEGVSLSTKELSQQLSHDLSERLERIQRAHSEMHVQQHTHQQHKVLDGSGSNPSLEQSASRTIKSSVAAFPPAVAAATTMPSDSLLEFVSTMDSRMNSAAHNHTSSSLLSLVSENAIGSNQILHSNAQSPANNVMDSLEAFVKNKSVSKGSTLSSDSPPVKSSIQIQNGHQKQLLGRDDISHSEDSSKPFFPFSSALSTSGSPAAVLNPAQKGPSHSLYRIDSSSPPLNESDSAIMPPRHKALDERPSDIDEPIFDNSRSHPKNNVVEKTSSIPTSDSLVTRKTAFLPTSQQSSIDGSTLHNRARVSKNFPDEFPSWLLPASPIRMPVSKNNDFDDFIGTFSLNEHSSSNLPSAHPSDELDDFTPSFQATTTFSNIGSESSLKFDAPTNEYDLSNERDDSKTFFPVSQKNTNIGQTTSLPHLASHTRELSSNFEYISRDSRVIELLAAAIKKVSLANCRSLSTVALNTLLTPILRKFDLAAFANKCKIPLLMAADLVELAPFNLHFVVDDTESVMNGPNWRDAQTLLEECIDFVSLVNSYGCTISFLSSTISQASLKTRDQVARVFARVISDASAHRFVAVPKPNVLAAFESKVFDPIFSGSSPALVYVLSLQDSVSRRDYLSADAMFLVQQTLDTRIANSKLVPQYVRMCVANVGQGYSNGYSSLLSELRSRVGDRMTFVEDFECDAEICKNQGVQLTPYIYVLKLLLGPVDPNYVD